VIAVVVHRLAAPVAAAVLAACATGVGGESPGFDAAADAGPDALDASFDRGETDASPDAQYDAASDAPEDGSGSDPCNPPTGNACALCLSLQCCSALQWCAADSNCSYALQGFYDCLNHGGLGKDCFPQLAAANQMNSPYSCGYTQCPTCIY
jgi:hypothetical protein